MKLKFISLLMCGALAGCGLPFSQSAIERTPEGQYLKQAVEHLTSRDYASIEAALAPEIAASNVRANLEQMASVFPAGEPTSIEFVGWNIRKALGGERSADVTAEYGYSQNKWVLVSLRLTGEPGYFRILGFQTRLLARSLSETNAFTFVGKGWLHYFCAMATALALATSVYALVLCLRTKGLKRKWLWVPFVAVGFCGFSLNWTSGEFHVAILQFNLLSASAFRMGFAGPWTLTFCIPVGALVFLSRRGKLAGAAPPLKVNSEQENPIPGSDPPPASPS